MGPAMNSIAFLSKVVTFLRNGGASCFPLSFAALPRFFIPCDFDVIGICCV